MREEELQYFVPIQGIDYEFKWNSKDGTAFLILSIDDSDPYLENRKTPEELDLYITLEFGNRILKDNVLSLLSLKQQFTFNSPIIKGYIDNPNLKTLGKDRDILYSNIEPTLISKPDLLKMKLGIKESKNKEVRHNYNGIKAEEKGNKFLVEMGTYDRGIDN